MRKTFCSILLLCVVSLLSIGEVNAMPEATDALARIYYVRLYNDEVSNLEEHFKSELDSLYAGVGGEGEYDPEGYDRYTQYMERAISEMKNRTPYTQEQAIDEIGRMIDNKKFPANYIFAKGQYKYTGNINAVVTKTNVNLRSQPNSNAIKLYVIAGPLEEAEGLLLFDVCSYMGEWTNPQGERWVAVKYHHDEKGDLIGWLSGKYTIFITDAQVMEIARAYERAKAAPRTTARNEYGRQEENYTASTPSYSSSSGGSAEEVSAEDLLRAWAQNPLRAEKTYKGKTLRIRGKVESIKTEGGAYYVEFDSYFSDLFKRAMAKCFVSRNDPLLPEIDTGRYVTIQGYVADVDAEYWIQAYTLTNCKIISAR